MSATLMLRAVAAVGLIPFLLGDGCDGSADNVAFGVLARERVALSATAAELVTALPVAEGTFVQAGTLLVQLDNSLQMASVATAQAELARAQAALDKLEMGARQEERAIAASRVEAARAASTEAQSAYERAQVLFERGTITQASFDQVVARRDATRAELASAEQAVAELNTGAREEDLRIAKASLAAAEARLAGENAKLESLSIRASRDGTLDSLPWNLGERVAQGSPVAVLLAGTTPFARVYVPEPYRVRMKEGITLQVRVDGIDAPFEGRLSWISDEPSFTPYYALNQTERSRLVFLAEVVLPEEASDLPVGVPVEVVLP